MKSREIWSQCQRLDHLFSLVSSLQADPELEAHWARYLCVLVSGFLETSIRTIYGGYARSKSAPFVANYVEQELRFFQNPSMEKILQLAGQFNPKWEEDLRKATMDEPKDAVDSIVANRHLVAHGGSVGLTYARVKRYYENVVRVVELVETECGP